MVLVPQSVLFNSCRIILVVSLYFIFELLAFGYAIDLDSLSLAHCFAVSAPWLLFIKVLDYRPLVLADLIFTVSGILSWLGLWCGNL